MEERNQLYHHDKHISRQSNEANDSNAKSALKEKKKRLIDINDFNANPIKKNEITSPKSLFCMKQLGIEQMDLIFVSFKDFCLTHPETITMSKEEQENRYNFIESMRKNRIDKITEERNDLVKAEAEEEEEQMIIQREKNEALLQTGMTNANTNTNMKSNSNINNQHDSNKTGSNTFNSTNEYYSSANDKEIEMFESINQKKLGNILQYELDKQSRFTSKRPRVDDSNRQSKRINDDSNYNRREHYSNEQEWEMKRKKIQAKQEVNNRNLANNIIRQEHQKKKISSNIGSKNNRISELKAHQYEEQKKKSEENRMKEIMKEDRIRQLKRLEEKEREKKSDELNNRLATFERNKERIWAMKENKQKTMQELQRKHNEDLIKLNRILLKGINDDTVKTIQQTFNDNEYVLNVANEYFNQNKNYGDKANDTSGKRTIKEVSNNNTKEAKKDKQIDDHIDKDKEETNKDKEETNKDKEEANKDNNKKNKQDDDKQDDDKQDDDKQDDKQDDDKQDEDKQDDDKQDDDKDDDEDVAVVQCKNNDATDMQSKEYTEEEITQKVKDYRIETNREFLKLLSREKANEEIREERLEKAATIREIKELEKQYGKERTMANYRLSIKNEELQEKVAKYEEKLRQHNEKLKNKE